MRLHTKTSSRLIEALAAAAVLLHTTTALADESAAERMFREGRALMLSGRFAEACPMLEESQKLEPHVGTLLNVAACHERQGKVGSAWVEYQKALTAARAEGQAERAQLAGERIKVLEPRVPWLRISSTTDDVTIALDGGRLEHVAWGQEMPVDPGPHTVTAERADTKVFEERLDLREGERRGVRVDVAAPVTPPAEPAQQQDRVVVEPKPAETPAAPSKPKNRWIFEAGILLGLVSGTAKYPTLSGSSNLRITRVSNGTTESRTCGEQNCEAADLSDGTGVAAGVSLFGGYALNEFVALGTRLVVAPSLGASGAGVYGFGPSVALRPTEALTLGVWSFFGNATFHGKADVAAPSGYELSGSGSNVNVEGDLHGAFGIGVDLSVRLLTLRRGELVANVAPLLLVGSNGSAVCLPLGLAYRFQ